MLNVQEMTARALLVDTEALAAAQQAGDVLGANAILMDAFYTDVRPDLADWRESRGLPADPMAAYAESGYQKRSKPNASAATGRLGRLSATRTTPRAAPNVSNSAKMMTNQQSPI